MTTDYFIARVKQEFAASAELKMRVAELFAQDIARIAEVIIAAMQAGGKLLFCGNGGSAADAQHFAAEMVGRLKRDRDPLPALALTTDSSILTAVGNDYSYEQVFSRQVYALGQPGDVLIVFSTSGQSANLRQAIAQARKKQMTSIALLGKSGGAIQHEVDHAIVIPDTVSQRIQEVHITIIHVWCDLIEDTFFPETAA
ncbi:D-sedoheptulose 7-phosphate isomerase [candidate division KSB1 bacterium]|nr:D-sedoheptulose 7-phosphate isomerase [candidate division KSB1 bacterium]